MVQNRCLRPLGFVGGLVALFAGARLGSAAPPEAGKNPSPPPPLAETVDRPPAATPPPAPPVAPAPPDEYKLVPAKPEPKPAEPKPEAKPPEPKPAEIKPPEPTGQPELAEDVVAARKPRGPGRPGGDRPPPGDRPRGPGRGFPAPGPWVSFYGPAKAVMPIERVANTFRIINIDADPGVGAWTPAQIQVLKAGGRNRVISYMNIGSCENFREYFKTVPHGMVPCKENLRAQRGRYAGYPTEIWMDPSNPDYQDLIVDHVALRLAKAGVDGFYLDNLEILEHGEQTSNGPCGSHCRQGGLELVARLRKAYPDHLIVMQNATSDVTRLGRTEDGPYPALLDGIAHEQVFAPVHDNQALQELQAWKAMNLTSGGRPFFIGVEDYVGDCTKHAKAKKVYAANRAHGFSPYASDASGGQQKICFWGF